MAKLLVHTGYGHSQSEKKEAAEHYGDDLYGSYENICGRHKAGETLYTLMAARKSFKYTICAFYLVVFQWKMLLVAWS